LERFSQPSGVVRQKALIDQVGGRLITFYLWGQNASAGKQHVVFGFMVSSWAILHRGELQRIVCPTVFRSLNP
jgi:hypothetical protein